MPRGFVLQLKSAASGNPLPADWPAETIRSSARQPCEHRADSNHSLIAVLSLNRRPSSVRRRPVAERPVALPPASSSERPMDFAWESICNFGSLRERDCFLTWMRDQIANGVAEEIEAPAGFDASERWFRHIPTGSLWRLVPAENPYGPGFWPAHDKAA